MLCFAWKIACRGVESQEDSIMPDYSASNQVTPSRLSILMEILGRGTSCKMKSYPSSCHSRMQGTTLFRVLVDSHSQIIYTIKEIETIARDANSGLPLLLLWLLSYHLGQ